MRGDAPHWAVWARHFEQGMQREPVLVSDQTALNHAIWMEELAVHPLPALCNWCCHLAAPIINHVEGVFCEPNIPYRELGIIHMTADTKDAAFNVDIRGTNVDMTFRHESFVTLRGLYS